MLSAHQLPEEFNGYHPILKPVAICSQREVLRNGRIESQFLVQWSGEPHENSTWVPTEDLRKLYPEFHLEDKVTFDGRPSVTPTIAQDIRSQPKSEVVEYQQADQKDDRAKYIREGHNLRRSLRNKKSKQHNDYAYY